MGDGKRVVMEYSPPVTTGPGAPKHPGGGHVAYESMDAARETEIRKLAAECLAMEQFPNVEYRVSVGVVFDALDDLLAALDAERKRADAYMGTAREEHGRTLDAEIRAEQAERDLADARAQVAALREAMRPRSVCTGRLLYGPDGPAWEGHRVACAVCREDERVATVLASTAQAAAEHDARVRREAERERDEARAQLAALQEAASEVVCDLCPYHRDTDETCSDCTAHERLRRTLASTDQAPAEHDARVRREGIERAVEHWRIDAATDEEIRALAEAKP